MIFFSNTTGVPFELFGPLYFALLAGVLILTWLMVHFRQKLKSFGHFKLIRYTSAGILFTNMAVYYISLMVTGRYDIKKHLPLEFCFITGYILMYLLITNNKRNLYSIIFYCSIVGPLPAMIWPSITGSYDRFIFYQFVISHHFMMLVSFYCMIVLGYKTNVKAALHAFLSANVVFIAISTLNYFWGSNYIMQQKLPDHIIKMFPFVTYFDYPFVWLELCGGAMILVGIAVSKLLSPDDRHKMPAIPATVKEAG